MIHTHVPESSTVYTPPELSAAMVAAARGTGDGVWLDPCVGDGAFVREMARLGISSANIHAIDVSPTPSVLDRAAQTVRGMDFLEWAINHQASVDHVVMNPPYVALNRVGGVLLERALQVRLADGRSLPFQANYWAAFLLTAVGCVREGGSLVAVLPAAWDYARYAARVRDTIEKAFGEITVVRCAVPLFPRVQEGVIVVIALYRGASPCTHRRVEASDLAETIKALEQCACGIVPPGASTMRALVPPPPTLRRLDEIVHIHIGAVTGDAGYFLMTERERRERGIPESALRPIVSRSKHLMGAEIGKVEWERLRGQGERVWMFWPSSSALRHNAVGNYVAYGAEGGCNRAAHKIAKRDVWYRTPLPARVDGFMSGMSKRLPFLVLRRMDRLTASNTLYVIRFKRRATQAERATLGVLLLTSQVRRELARHARVYADGLLKFEPTDLGGVRVPVVQPGDDAEEVHRQATALLLAGREAEASAIADEWVAQQSGTGTKGNGRAAERAEQPHSTFPRKSGRATSRAR